MRSPCVPPLVRVPTPARAGKPAPPGVLFPARSILSRPASPAGGAPPIGGDVPANEHRRRTAVTAAATGTLVAGALCLTAAAPASAATDYTIDVDTAATGPQISDSMYGIFM